MKPVSLKSLVIVAAVFLLAGCRRDMFNQPKSNPLRESDSFSDGVASRPIPPHTIDRSVLVENEAFYTGMNGSNLVAEIPQNLEDRRNAAHRSNDKSSSG